MGNYNRQRITNSKIPRFTLQWCNDNDLLWVLRFSRGQVALRSPVKCIDASPTSY